MRLCVDIVLSQTRVRLPRNGAKVVAGRESGVRRASFDREKCVTLRPSAAVIKRRRLSDGAVALSRSGWTCSEVPASAMPIVGRQEAFMPLLVKRAMTRQTA